MVYGHTPRDGKMLLPTGCKILNTALKIMHYAVLHKFEETSKRMTEKINMQT